MSKGRTAKVTATIASKVAGRFQQPRPTTVCTAVPHPATPTVLRPIKSAAAGAIGGRVARPRTPPSGFRGVVVEPTTLVKPVRSPTVARIAGSYPGIRPLAATVEPEPAMEIRVRGIYAVDDHATPAWPLARVQAVLAALVQAANRDLVGTGIRLVTFGRTDVEIRPDTLLRKDIVLDPRQQAALTSGAVGEAEGKAIIDAAWAVGERHRNAVAAERPNTMLWIFSRGNLFQPGTDQNGNFVWQYSDDRGGNFSGGTANFVALHENFLASVAGARADASRAVHESGHYLGLWHTHREPFHDLRQTLQAANTKPDAIELILKDTATCRLAEWTRIVTGWVDAQLPAGAAAKQAEQFYDADRPGVTDSPADPGAGIIALANEVAGNGANDLGPVASITLDVPGVTGPMVLTPLRDNPMSYYLQETPAAMRFTPDQIKIMRNLLIDGARRPLVAAQLGDTGTPGLRVCAVWSPNTKGQRLTWGHSRDDHQAEHEAMRKAGMMLVHQQAYTLNGKVLYDGIWDPGTQNQEILLGWLDEHVRADLPKRAARGMLPAAVQGYQHLNDGTRYNVVYEPGTTDARPLLGVTQDELGKQWKALMPKGYRMTCVSSHIDGTGVIRYSTVLRPTGNPQSWVAGWTLDDMAREYGKRWDDGWRIRHVALVKHGGQQLWSAVFEPDTQNQLVYWKHVRERITEVYDEMWAIGFKLRTMCVAPA